MSSGDVKLFQTNDGGDIEVNNGIVKMSGGLETAVYLSLFGGNEDDPGESDKRFSWWGNINETVPYRSRTQFLLRALVASAANLRRVEEAAKADLEWLVQQGVANKTEVSASIPGLNRVKFEINIISDLGSEKIVFSENWKAEI